MSQHSKVQYAKRLIRDSFCLDVNKVFCTGIKSTEKKLSYVEHADPLAQEQLSFTTNSTKFSFNQQPIMLMRKYSENSHAESCSALDWFRLVERPFTQLLVGGFLIAQAGNKNIQKLYLLEFNNNCHMHIYRYKN